VVLGAGSSHTSVLFLFCLGNLIKTALGFRLKVKEDVIAEMHGSLLQKDEEIASLKSLLDEQKNKNNVSSHSL